MLARRRWPELVCWWMEQPHARAGSEDVAARVVDRIYERRMIGEPWTERRERRGRT
jgi:hypothetical protein